MYSIWILEPDRKMLGSKLRSWMEAVRPKRKQNRKDKQIKSKNSNECPSPKIQNFEHISQITAQFEEKIESKLSSDGALQSEPTSSRYSVANLSSPESAYSTGYSTDGTSPGAAPDYYTGIKSKLEAKQPKTQCDMNPSNQQAGHKVASPLQENNNNSSNRSVLNTAVEVASPRQRNRIRTNPWLPTCINPVNKQWSNAFPAGLSDTKCVTNSNQYTVSSPKLRRKSLSSSSCSSLSGAETYWEGSEEDRTLNEMMGKYDESYVYEKETDILSDSEPTDLDTDIDTGQDGGDELEPQEGDMFYIDDGSFIETEPGENKNTGHCSYFNFQERRKVSRRKTTRKSRHKIISHKNNRTRTISSQRTEPASQHSYSRCDGSRSVGTTPLFNRRTQLPISKLALGEKLAKRSNSVYLYIDSINSIDRKDEEAEQKYEELIVEAEHLLRNIKTEGLSPRRLPGPANKRVELLRSAECPKSTRVVDLPSSNVPSFRLLSRPILQGGKQISLPKSPLSFRKPPERQSLHRSPKHKKKSSKTRKDIITSSSDDERPTLRAPPRSEPVKRKVYSSSSKNMIFYPNNSSPLPQRHRNSAESLRHQVLINTISNLKKSLENQSASLKQAYRSPVHCPPCL
ncbi:hypothetical protein HHI36_022781 [Cryptolaemus montrouzieri]|uniref:Uncharacterized protein n=1 Tax=Cryptolaemus montrouzieri TaxID=559131 RepID=A0ABD2PEZ3_9CUCU